MRKDKTVKIVEDVLNEHKATDIVTIDVHEKTPFADFYILATAGNIRQLNALKELVEEALEKNKMSINQIVNIFSKAERERISLEEVMAKK